MDLEQLKKVARQEGEKVVDSLKTAIGDEWDNVSEETKEYVLRAGRRVGELALDKLQGKDVEQEMKLLASVVLDFKVAGRFKTAVLASKAQDAFWEGAKRAAQSLAGFLFEAVIVVAKGAI